MMPPDMRRLTRPLAAAIGAIVTGLSAIALLAVQLLNWKDQADG